MDNLSFHFAEMIGAVALAFVFYPMTIAPTGEASNGGALGLGALVIGSVLAWRAFALNHRSPWLRRLLQLPVVAIVTFLAIHDGFAQWVSGKWLWFY